MRVSLMRKLWKTGEVVSNILKIRCLICDEVKNEEDFHEKGNSYLGKDRRCKTCKIEVSKQWHLDNPGHHLKKYNITLEDFDNMLKKRLIRYILLMNTINTEKNRVLHKDMCEGTCCM